MWEFGAYIYAIFWIKLILDDFKSLTQYVLWFWHRRTVNLKEKYGDWVVITGASDGIGKEFAKAYAKRNINVALIGRNKEKLQNVASEVEALGVEAKIIIADFNKGKEIYPELQREIEKIPVGILVNNVGVQYEYPMAIEDLPEQEIWDNFNVNIASAVMLTKMVLPQMIERNKGAIVNVSSIAGQTAQPYMNLYAASKSYMTYFSQGLQWEMKNKNRDITVQTLTPYYISTKINHFQPALQKVSIFTPDAETYAKSAIDCLGILDNTTGYWSHRIIWLGFHCIPYYIRHCVIGQMYKNYNRAYLKHKDKNKTR